LCSCCGRAVENHEVRACRSLACQHRDDPRTRGAAPARSPLLRSARHRTRVPQRGSRPRRSNSARSLGARSRGRADGRTAGTRRPARARPGAAGAPCARDHPSGSSVIPFGPAVASRQALSGRNGDTATAGCGAVGRPRAGARWRANVSGVRDFATL
jgi:hypothetical protein